MVGGGEVGQGRGAVSNSMTIYDNKIKTSN